MAAHVEDKFKNGFLLDEERLRKLSDIISERLNSVTPPLQHNFHVYRADSFAYDTSNLNDIIAEDNADWCRITKLEVKVPDDERLKFNMVFNEEGTFLKMEGEDRDMVYLLLSDLKDYLKNEVNICRHISREQIRNITIFIMVGFMTLMCVIMFFLLDLGKVDDSVVNEALSSDNISKKLNYLIERGNSPYADNIDYFSYILLLMPIFFIVSTTKILQRTLTFFFPANIFLFGAQIQRYSSRRRIISQILWGGIVAFSVSFLASVAVFLLTKGS